LHAEFGKAIVRAGIYAHGGVFGFVVVLRATARPQVPGKSSAESELDHERNAREKELKSREISDNIFIK